MTCGRVADAGCVEEERLITGGRVVGAGRAVESASFSRRSRERKNSSNKAELLRVDQSRDELRFVLLRTSSHPQQLDELVYSLPMYTVAETRVIPLIDFGDRRANVEALFRRMTKR